MGKRYTNQSGREQFTEYGGGSDNRTTPDGRRVPLTASQAAREMRQEGLAERIGETDYDTGERQVGKRTFRPR
ncbi:hypothetical protein [Glaciihabitans sp. UYNi722]|uniref:hypothetical protein n=1 Tax=Glaciihabitans sp. UYNi722 TaxID=3156344 RepID=UPI0033954973